MWFTLLILLDLWLANWFICWVIDCSGIGAVYVYVAVPLLYYGALPRLPEWRGFRRLGLWRWARRVYFHGTQVPLRPLHGPGSQVLYVAWPHGVYAESISAVLLTSDEFADVLPICSSVLFAIPLLRELASLMGAVPANVGDIEAALAVGRSLVILPEGMRGALNTTREDIVRLMRKRTGYLEIALRHPRLKVATLQVHTPEPPYERVIYASHSWASRLQHAMLHMVRYPWPLLHWGWGYSFLPRRQRITFLLDTNTVTIDPAIPTTLQTLQCHIESSHY